MRGKILALKVGSIESPDRPYTVVLEIENLGTVSQPVTETEFFEVIQHIAAKRTLEADIEIIENRSAQKSIL